MTFLGNQLQNQINKSTLIFRMIDFRIGLIMNFHKSFKKQVKVKLVQKSHLDKFLFFNLRALSRLEPFIKLFLFILLSYLCAYSVTFYRLGKQFFVDVFEVLCLGVLVLF
jgi:hypothetical protein